MKNIITKISMILVCSTQMFLMSASMYMQETTEKTKPDNSLNNCVEIKLTTTSDSLNENVPISLTATIYNKCKEKVEFLYRPSFILDKVESDTKVRKRFGQTRLGVIFRDGAIEPSNTKYYMNEGQELEFVSNTSEIKWQDAFSSQELFVDTYEGLEMGEYHLQAKINLVLVEKGKMIIKKVYSNKVGVSHKVSN